MSPYSNGARQILLVEDNPGDATLIEELLESQARRGELIHVVDLRGALAQLERFEIDVVLLDLRLPDGFGVQCVSAVRSSTPEIPIVVLTGVEDDDLALSCIRAGAQDYVPKDGLQAQALQRAIGYAVARTRERLERRRANELQERLAAIVEASSDAIVSTTLDGIVASWNRGAERIFGYAREEAKGKRVSEVMRPVDEADTREQIEFIRRGRDGPCDEAPEEIVCLRKDGTPVTLSVVASDLRDAAGSVVALAAIARDITDSKRRDEELRRKNDELVRRDRQMSALAARLNAIREEEGARISREVHDELGQLLTGLKMDLRWIERRLAPDVTPAAAAIAAKLTDAAGLIDVTIETVQRIAVELRPSALDVLGLSAAIRDEARRFERRAGIATEVRVDDASRPDPAAATALFRILQELCTNVARHARASSVRIDLNAEPEVWVLRVEDDGVGLKLGDEERTSSLGLLGIRERAQSLGGVVSFEGGDRGGTRATVRIPRSGEEAHAQRAHRG